MTDRLDDERIQFFLRHRDDIRSWAAIESDVSAAVREILASTQSDIEERLLAIDADATIARRDNKKWERIQAFRPGWPDWSAVTLEWETNVDPFGSLLPKLGVFILGSEPDVQAGRLALIQALQASGELQGLGYRIAADNVWAAMRRLKKSKDWWQDLDGWTTSVVDDFVELWERVAPYVDRAVLETKQST